MQLRQQNAIHDVAPWAPAKQPRLSLWAQYHTGRGFFRAEDGPVDHQSGGRLPCHCLCLWANRTSMGLYTKHRNNACHQSFQDFSRPSQQLTMSYSSSASLTPGSGKTHTMEGYRYRAQADTPQVGSCTLMGFGFYYQVLSPLVKQVGISGRGSPRSI